jgi:Sulfotransferase domain
MAVDRPIFAYFGHHKCASGYAAQIVAEICRYMGMKYVEYYTPKMWGYDVHGNALDRVVTDNGIDCVSFHNADSRYLGEASEYVGFHLIRDPRDIVVSGYFSHKNSHPIEGWPELEEFRKELKRLPKDEGMMENIKFTATLPTDGWNIELFRTMMEWDYSRENIIEIKFEEMVANPYELFLQVFNFMKIVADARPGLFSFLNYYIRDKNRFRNPRTNTIPEWVALLKLHDNRFAKAAKGRKRGVSDESSHYRKGMPGDWRNHFTDDHKAYFKRNYNDLLIKLGYEKDDKW